MKIMALTENGNELVMPVGPLYGNGGGGFAGFGGDWGSLIVLFLIAAMFGGFGNGFGGGFGGGNGDFPWLMSGQAGINANTNGGFRDAMLQDSITSVRDGINGISTQLCNGFAGVEQGANARQIANMQTAFGLQTAMNTGFNGLQNQLANCCCENRLATCQTQNVIQNEGSQTRFADANNTRDIITNQTANTQAILDKLCQLELDGKNDKIADLERQLTMANLQASQTAQNAFIQQGLTDEVDQLYNRLSNCPVPTTPVYGRTPIFTCNNGGCGCAGNNF
jgi:hypothetical protein